MVLGNPRGQELDFDGGDPDHDADPGIFIGILPLPDRGNYKSFAENSRSCRRILIRDPNPGILQRIFLPGDQCFAEGLRFPTFLFYHFLSIFVLYNSVFF